MLDAISPGLARISVWVLTAKPASTVWEIREDYLPARIAYMNCNTAATHHGIAAYSMIFAGKYWTGASALSSCFCWQHHWPKLCKSCEQTGRCEQSIDVRLHTL